ncbi:jg1212 [Pararge aegeria aegeria]|uniref:Jg1212 protein n=1 Tax=Pararge aegeria aegeria TaxID=348720 RepID=A0A8S4R7L5_9NEOP|nr:jg1212 [Pararge aegeria aegeria]
MIARSETTPRAQVDRIKRYSSWRASDRADDSKWRSEIKINVSQTHLPMERDSHTDQTAEPVTPAIRPVGARLSRDGAHGL